MEITFKLADVSRIESNLRSQAQEFTGRKDFHFEIQISGQINPEQKLFALMVAISIYDKPNGQQLGFLKSGISFQIDNFEEVVMIDPTSHRFELPREINETFISIALSTTRGMMVEHFKGTGLQGALLPLLDPKSFVSDQESQ